MNETLSRPWAGRKVGEEFSASGVCGSDIGAFRRCRRPPPTVPVVRRRLNGVFVGSPLPVH